MLRALGADAIWRHPAEGLAALALGGLGLPGRAEAEPTDKWSGARWAARFGSRAQTPWQDPREKRFGSDCGQSHAWGLGCAVGLGSGQAEWGEGWRSSRQCQPPPRVRERAKAWPPERPRAVPGSPSRSAAPSSPGGWAGLGGAAGAAGPSGGRAVSPQSSPGRSGRTTLGVGVRGAGVTSGAQDAERRGGAPERSLGCVALGPGPAACGQ